jgi:uncharacterized membrane protein (UPF0127 family)
MVDGRSPIKAHGGVLSGAGSGFENRLEDDVDKGGAFAGRSVILEPLTVKGLVMARLHGWLLAGFFLFGLADARAQEPAGAPRFDIEALGIESANGMHLFSVEVARTAEQREYGLMGRTDLPENGGMLFDFGGVGYAVMWMKDTLIPLDMLFVKPDGTIGMIYANARPLSEETIKPGIPVRAVIELNAGTAARLGIKVGDRVHHPLFAGVGL